MPRYLRHLASASLCLSITFGLLSPSYAQSGPSGILAAIAARDAGSVQRHIDEGAFVGKQEYLAALLSSPHIYEKIVVNMAVKPKRNDCTAIAYALTNRKFGNNHGDDIDTLRLLNEHLLDYSPPHSCTAGTSIDILGRLYNAIEYGGSDKARPLGRLLIQKGVLPLGGTHKADWDSFRGEVTPYSYSIMQTISSIGYFGHRANPETLDLAIEIAQSAAGARIADISVATEMLANKIVEAYVSTKPDTYEKINRLLKILLDQGGTVSPKTSTMIRDKTSPIARQAIALIDASQPSNAGHEKQLALNRELVNTIKTYRHDPELFPRILNLVKRGANPNQIKATEVGFDSFDECLTLGQLMLKSGRIDVARGLLEKFRDEMVSGLKAPLPDRACRFRKDGMTERHFYVDGAIKSKTSFWFENSLGPENGREPEAFVLFLLEQGLPIEKPETALINAAEKGYTRVATALIARGAPLERAFELTKRNEKILQTLVAAAGREGERLLANHTAKLAEEKAEHERAQLAYEKRRAAENKEQQKRNEEAAALQYKLSQQAKSVGDGVCMSGEVGFIFKHTARVKGYVEAVSGRRIQIRIADLNTSVRYNDVDLRENSLIWDDFTNWIACS